MNVQVAILALLARGVMQDLNAMKMYVEHAATLSHVVVLVFFVGLVITVTGPMTWAGVKIASIVPTVANARIVQEVRIVETSGHANIVILVMNAAIVRMWKVLCNMVPIH